jgi:hypothetical protein
VKHGPKHPGGRVSVDGVCAHPGCRNEAMPGRFQCLDHEPTEPDKNRPRKKEERQDQ